MSELPKPSLEQAVKALANNDNFLVILESIEDERDYQLVQLDECETPEKVMKTSGKISALDQVIRNISG